MPNVRGQRAICPATIMALRNVRLTLLDLRGDITGRYPVTSQAVTSRLQPSYRRAVHIEAPGNIGLRLASL